MSQALIVIDVQKAFDHHTWGKRNNPQAEQQIRNVIESWREKDELIIHIQHVSENPDSLFYLEGEGVGFKSVAQPLIHEKVIQKRVNSAFIGTDLESYLRGQSIEGLVIIGLTTPHCVSTTTRMSSNLGFKTILISDATASFDLTDHTGTTYDADKIQSITLATLHHEFAEVVSTEELLKRRGAR